MFKSKKKENKTKSQNKETKARKLLKDFTKRHPGKVKICDYPY